MHYKDYSIEALETSRGRWRARIRRRDGQTIKILIDGDETESFMIGGMESFHGRCRRGRGQKAD